MKFSEIKNLNRDELVKRIKGSREDLFDSRMKHSLGQLSNTDHIRKIRRVVARLKTALHLNTQKEVNK